MIFLFEEFSTNIRNLSLYIPFYISNTLRINIGNRGEKILDVGCGWGQPMEINIIRNNYTVGMDIFLPYLKKAKLKKTHDEYILCDAKKLPFKDKSFDIVLCLEVIEHLEKKEGLQLIEELEKVTRNRVIITTPVGFWPDAGRDNDPYQIHIAGFYPKEFTNLGYTVRGFGIRNINLISFSPLNIQIFIKRLIRILFGPLSYYFPVLGERMICIKIIANSKGN